MIKALGNRLQALHIHDNDLHDDSHQIPFSMKIDFDKVANALREIGYKGYLTLECNGFMRAYTKENVFEGVKKLAESVKRLNALIESA
jgi:sugar phosphate isomerase/epimerase